jgi:hypothetical protein
MRTKLLFILLVTLLALLLALTAISLKVKKQSPNIPPPAQETTGKEDIIVVDYPKPNDLVTSPLVVTGKARGTWYFESSFPVTLTFGTNTSEIQTYATAQGEWMTEEFVPFTVTIEFSQPAATKGILTLTKDNPSDLRELDDSISIPVRFK